MRPWGAAERRALRSRLRDTAEPWDLVVVGAGITGAGIARDAAMRGLSVLVLEAADVAFGTSSRSTRLVHGGVRYLEQGELGLVYEALRERARLYQSAPHLVHATRFLFPAYRGDRLGPWKLRLGLTLYDTLNFHRGEPHEYLTPEAARMAEPLLAEAGLRGAVAYEDAVTDDARLTLAVVLDARRHGAEVLTYAPVVAIEATAAPARHRVLLDDGTAVAAHAVVVAAGPWSSATLLGARGNDLLTLSKGTHLVVRARDVPVRQPLVVQVPREKRILFVVPWGSRTYLGTTDAAYEGDPGKSGVTADDEREILELVRPVLPTARLDAAAIVSAWSGVRPLVRAEGARSTAEVSRKHRIVERDDGVLAIVGGKLTTYRQMAEEIVDRVVARVEQAWPAEHARAQPCTTATVPLVVGEPEPSAPDDDQEHATLVSELASRHGPIARAMAAAADAAGRARIIADLPYRWCEVDHAIGFEGAVHAIDVVRRRLPLVLTDAQQGATAIVEIATRLVDAAGGSARDIDDELERWRAEVAIETGRTPTIPR
ncbi:MAG: glycerol-3-phosphate dehydrogenase/oxidase [Nannocystaceae bacterium]|nr:glycerol-3-phosphate dehydrogenase/oxidase [Nannocystaceae bacterium]